jgi:hypothetical protein
MSKTLTALATAAMLAIASVSAPTPAEARGGAVAAGIIGGIAAGAIVGSALAGPRYYYGGPYYPYDYGPAYYYGPPPGPCYWRRERFWDGYGYVVRRVRVCY